jgi:hypothetical protein
VGQGTRLCVLEGRQPPFLIHPDGTPWTLEAFTAGVKTTGEWSVSRYSELTDDLRVDADYYRPLYLAQEKRLNTLNPKPLSALAYVGDGNHMPISERFTDTGVRYLRGQDLSDFFISDSNPVYIPMDEFEKLERSEMKTGDVLLSIVGTIGSVAIVTDKYQHLTGSYKLAIIRPSSINRFYMAAYLASSVGQDQIARRIRGAVQQGLILPDLREFPIPMIDDQVAIGAIERLIRDSRSEQEKSESLYAEAEALLLAELGLDQLDLTHQANYTAQFSQAWGAGRLDAEYFQPKYESALKIMRQSGKVVRDVVHLAKRRFEPQVGEPFQYIEIGDLGQAGAVESQALSGEDAPSRAQWIVKTGDVITSTVRPIRRLSAIIQPEQNGFVCSSGFAVLEPASVEPEVLLVYLRLPIICEIMDLFTSASMYPAISTTELLNLPIALASDDLRRQVVRLVQESQVARQAAHRLLEDAKRRVEEMVLGEAT